MKLLILGSFLFGIAALVEKVGARIYSLESHFVDIGLPPDDFDIETTNTVCDRFCAYAEQLTSICQYKFSIERTVNPVSRKHLIRPCLVCNKPVTLNPSSLEGFMLF